MNILTTERVFGLELNSILVKTVNGEVQLQALLDGKKIIVTEASKLTFYKEFFSPQWKFLIHTILQCLSTKTTAWNEFSSTMASAIICLATNQKFNFSKYIFESMVKNLENVSGKFLMYPRFVQVLLEKQMEGMSNHKRIYVTPSHTKKIFGNMRRVGKGFSRRETPFFPTMMVQAQEEIGEHSIMPTDPHHTPTIIQPSTSQPQKKQRSRRTNRKDTKIPQSSNPTDNVADKAVNEEMDDSLVRVATTATGLDAEQDNSLLDLFCSFSPLKIDFYGLEVSSIRRIQWVRYGVLEFLEVRTTFDIFQNIRILYLRYGVLTSSGYGVLSFIPLWSLVSAGTDTPYLP
ncbi:hypothetical protein Tco_0185565 [Tanacetum coccineum]